MGALGTAFILTVLKPERGTFALALALRLGMTAHQAPMQFDSALWKAQTDLATLLALAVRQRERVLDGCGWVIVGQMALFYLASGFWKINAAFLDSRASCAPILFLSLLEYLPECLTPVVLTRFLTVIAPWTTIVGEMAIGGLLLGNKALRCAGIVLAVLLHFMIAVTPFPNQIPTFGMYCVSRLYFCLPESWSLAQAEILWLPVTMLRGILWAVFDGTLKRAKRALVAAALVLGLVIAAKANSNPAFEVNWAIVFYFFLTYIAVYAVYLETRSRGRSTAWRVPARATESVRRGGIGLLLLAFFYSFGSQVLGVMELGLANPFASLRMHGGSNHLFMPTALLDVSGGVVRVEACNSTFINALYPGESTKSMSPRLRKMLTESGHIGRQFAPSVRRALGAELRAFMPPNEANSFVSWTTTAYELRRILAEAKAANESFGIEYTKLADSEGDERWRSEAAGRTYYYQSRPGWSQCERVLDAGSGAAQSKEMCSAEEVAMAELPAPSGLLSKTLVNFPYPLVPELVHAGVLPCMD